MTTKKIRKVTLKKHSHTNYQKNPGGVINGIKYFYDFQYEKPIYLKIWDKYIGQRETLLNTGEIITLFKNLIQQFSDILDQKFPQIKNKCPLIILTDSKSKYFKNIDIKKYELHTSAIYDLNNNLIITYITFLKYNPKYALRTLFHELGHFIYFKYLDKNAIKEYYKFIGQKYVEINLIKLLNKTLTSYKSDEEILLKDPVLYVVTRDMNNELKHPKNTTVKIIVQYIIEKGKTVLTYNDPVSDYMSTDFSRNHKNRIDLAEIFAETFANYMMYDKHMLSNDNYQFLRYLIPELRS